MPYIKLPPPEGLSPSLRRRWSALQDLIAKNAAAEEKLAKYQVQINPASFLAQRLQALIDVLFPFDGDLEDQVARLEIDERVQRGAAEFLESARSQVTQAMLAQGTQLPPDLVKAMAAQQGLNGSKLIRGKR